MSNQGGLGFAKERLLAKTAATEAAAAGGRAQGPGRFWEKPHRGQLQQTLDKFNTKAEDTKKNLERNPFSETYVKPEYHINDDRYGRPEQGSLTEKRGIAAGNSISQEIIELCQVITDRGRPVPDDTTVITFGELFQIYTKISNKVVGMLLRGRKHGLVQFKGEMLFQGRDDNVVITLLKPMSEVLARVGRSGDPARCLAEQKKP